MDVRGPQVLYRYWHVFNDAQFQKGCSSLLRRCFFGTSRKHHVFPDRYASACSMCFTKCYSLFENCSVPSEESVSSGKKQTIHLWKPRRIQTRQRFSTQRGVYTPFGHDVAITTRNLKGSRVPMLFNQVSSTRCVFDVSPSTFRCGSCTKCTLWSRNTGPPVLDGWL